MFEHTALGDAEGGGDAMCTVACISSGSKSAMWLGPSWKPTVYGDSVTFSANDIRMPVEL